MSDKFNFDDFKNIDALGYDSSDISDIDIDTILKDFKEKDAENVKDEKKSPVINIENSEIVKPEGLSITGVFEAIHSEKKENIQDDKIDSDSDDTPKNKFFDTETFNSIKEESHDKHLNPIASFAKGSNEEEDVEGEEIPVNEPTEEIDDYETEEEREDILSELRRIRSSASFKSVLTFILMCLSGALFAALITGFTLPGIDIAYDTKIYVPIMLLVSLAATVLNIASLWKGFLCIFRLKCVSETFLVMAFLLSFVLDICYIVLKTPASECVVFDFLYLLMLFFSINSKRIIANNIYKNFAIVSSDGAKMVMDNRQNDELVNDIIVDTGCSNEIAYAARSEFVSDFIRRSFLDFDLCSSYSAPGMILFCASVLAAVVNYAVIGSFTTSLKFAAGVFCAVTPLLQAMSFAVSVYSNSKKARKNGGAIIGAVSCTELNDIQTVVVDDADIFSVALNGIRFYGDSTADKVILYLNSLYRVTGGPLKALFGNMLSEDIKTLPRIDDIYYHDTMGYSALINSKVFIAGNKNLMEHFGIEIDDSDYEIIYQQKSKHVLFAAYDGKLAGVFLLSYSLLSGVKKAFKMYEKDQVCVVIAQHDENVNNNTLFYHYNTDDKLLFRIMNFGNSQRCVQKFQIMNKAPSLLASRTGICGLSYALHGCKSVKFALSASRVIRIISSVIAFALVAFLSFFSGITTSFPLQILAYQLLWAIPSVFVSLFSK